MTVFISIKFDYTSRVNIVFFLRFLVYSCNCQLRGLSCNSILAIPPRYDCGWCLFSIIRKDEMRDSGLDSDRRRDGILKLQTSSLLYVSSYSNPTFLPGSFHEDATMIENSISLDDYSR